MSSPPFNVEETKDLIRRHNFNVAVAARTAGLSRSTLRSRVDWVIRNDPEFAAEYSKAQDARRDYLAGRLTQEPERWAPPDDWQRVPAAEFPQLPDPDPSYDELKEERIRSFERLHAHREAAKLIQVRVKIDGPYGILVMGDPHVDDDGTNWPLLNSHTQLIRRTEGLFGANVGDLTNNWVGRLARLYAEQNMGRRRAIKLAEGWLRENRWLWIDPGNHDMWSGSDDPVRWITRFAGIHYKWQGSRLELVPPSGRSIVVNSRHDHPGHSQFHPTHGPLKASIWDGYHDDIYTCGHIHSGGYITRFHQQGNASHCIRLSSYKVYDQHKDERGFLDQHLPAVVCIVNPAATSELGVVKVFIHPEDGADYLIFLRRKVK